MQYFSLHNQSPIVDFKQATINGQAPDKGLYFPTNLPALELDFIKNINQYSNEEIAYSVIAPYVGNAIPSAILQDIVAQTINFSIPLVSITQRISALEMFHGNTLAFKDVGARFMSRCLGYFVKNQDAKVTVLVATSGDTGGAVADGFFDVEGVEVVILYPSGKVSTVQEKQLTTLGNNIKSIEVNGTFDDCQRMVKLAFMDEDLKSNLFLTSANSINVARWLPQQFFYFLAYKQWNDKKNPPVIAVPSGNFGNICAGLLALKTGLPIKHFLAACNANEVVPDFIRTGEYKPQQSIPTISNAMDVGDPSNFVRILHLFDNDINKLKSVFSAVSISDEQTKSTLQKVYAEHQYIMDPHGAVGYCALENYLHSHPLDAGIFGETAHPVKFFDVVEPVISEKIKLPSAIEHLMNKEKVAIKMDAQFNDLKSYLLS